MSLSDEPEFLRNCPVQARNDLEPIIREFIEAIRKQASPSIQEFIDRVPGEHQPYLLHELLLEQKESLGPDLSDASIERYRRDLVLSLAVRTPIRILSILSLLRKLDDIVLFAG
jgi:hypothetical protein